jgi:glutathione S-transferase
MKLYYMPAACSLSPHIVANELELDIEFVRVNFSDHRTAAGRDYYEINPHGYIPALDLGDGRMLFEGPAIVQYLADLKPERGLAPPNGTFERYKLQEMLSFLSTEIHKGFIPLLYSKQAGTYLDMAKPKLEKRYAWIDDLLSSRRYVMGSMFTVADAYLFALTSWGQASWFKSFYNADIQFEELQNLKAWYERIQKRNSVRQSIVEEGLPLV